MSLSIPSSPCPLGYSSSFSGMERGSELSETVLCGRSKKWELTAYQGHYKSKIAYIDMGASYFLVLQHNAVVD